MVRRRRTKDQQVGDYRHEEARYCHLNGVKEVPLINHKEGSYASF